MSDTYKTITQPAEALYKEKMSRFIAFAFPVKTADEAKEKVNELQKEYYDARHVCYAYMLGHARTEFRANDNGEPSGTAGKPILGQINSFELTDILIVVVRYFGGIKLGTGGLTAAYKEAAKLVLLESRIIEKTVDVLLCVHFDYIRLNDVMRIVKETEAEIVSQTFEMTCMMTLQIRQANADELKNRLSKVETLSFEE